MFSILTLGVPFLAAPATLLYGLRKTLIFVCGIGTLMLLGPYIYFGAWALMEGVDLMATLKAVAVTLSDVGIVVGWMLAWSITFGAIVALLRLCWTYWRASS